MYLRDLLASLVRRWYFTFLVLLATVGLCVLAGRVVPPTYETTASVLLVPPKDPDTPDANRLLALGTLSQAKDVLVRSMNVDETKRRLTEGIPGADFEATADFTTAAPIIVVRAEGRTSSQSRQVAESVLADVPQILTSLQEELSIEQADQITAIQLSEGATPKVVSKATIRAQVAAIGLGLVGGSVLIGFIDGLLMSRKKRELLATSEPDRRGQAMPLPPTPQNVETDVKTRAQPKPQTQARPKTKKATTRPRKRSEGSIRGS